MDLSRISIEIRAKDAQVGDGVEEQSLVGRLGEAANDEDAALVIHAGELHCRVGAGDCRERRGRLDHRERELDRGTRAGIRSQGEPAVLPRGKSIVVEEAQRSVRAGKRHLEDRRDLARTQAIRSLRQRDEDAQAMLGSDEAAR